MFSLDWVNIMVQAKVGQNHDSGLRPVTILRTSAKLAVCTAWNGQKERWRTFS
jgi:hypothetical protein